MVRHDELEDVALLEDVEVAGVAQSVLQQRQQPAALLLVLQGKKNTRQPRSTYTYT